jgi:hypothetical protein
MSTSEARVIAIVLLLTMSVLAGPMAIPDSGEPAKVSTIRIQTFTDGSDVVEGFASEIEHLVVELDVPAGSQVLNASVVVSRLRYDVIELPLYSVPRSLWCGDLDNDGVDDDVILAYPDDGLLEVMSLEGDPPSLSLKAWMDIPDATSVIADDLDRDRDLDIVVTSGSESSVYIFEATGPMEYANPRIIPVGPRPGALAAHDMDPDFRRDLIVANTGGSSVTLLFGRGDLNFYPRRLELGRGPSALNIRDMDKDLDMDLIVAESRNSTVAIYYNEGNGNLTNATILPTPVGPVDLDARDLNGDSLVDVAVTCAGSNETWVFRQDEEGDFWPWEVLPVGGAPRAVTAVHLNRGEDLNRDLLTACSASDNLTVYLSDGSLSHTIPLEIEVGGRPVDVGLLRGNRGEDDTIIAICQLPPSLVIARHLPVAEIITLGFETGSELLDETTLEAGTEEATINLTTGMAHYIQRNNAKAFGGNLRVHLEAYAVRGGWLRISELDVWVRQNRPPRADAGRAVTVLLGEPVVLNGSASYDQDGDALEYLWIMPQDTAPSHFDNISQHIFMASGIYTVLLVVRDPWGAQDQDVVEVRVNAPPTARGTVPDTVTAREPVRLSAHLSEDPDGSIDDYIWDYSLGVVHGRTVDVLFTGSGVWNVTLEVVDNMGARAIKVWQVEVLPSEEPLRPPGEQVPEDRGEVPGPGALLSASAMIIAAGLCVLVRQRTRGPSNQR